jgi:hypothetical protein
MLLGKLRLNLGGVNALGLEERVQLLFDPLVTGFPCDSTHRRGKPTLVSPNPFRGYSRHGVASPGHPAQSSREIPHLEEK